MEKILEVVKKIVDPDEQLESEFREILGGFEVEFWEMYERPQITFDKLKQISEAFSTDLIDLSDGRSYGGCDTCDYGSSYGVTITVRVPKIDQLKLL